MIYKTKINMIYKRDEIYWRQRARYQWLQKGDVNTVFFYRVENMRKRKNTVHPLQIKEGLIEENADIHEHLHKFFRNLFGTKNSSRLL